LEVLEAKAISKHFGGVKAVDQLSLRVPEDSITAVIGPNGAGKSTLFNVLTGLHAPDTGTIVLDGEDITGHQPHETNRKGLARTFQKIRPFKRLTVLHNVVIGFHTERETSLWQTVLRSSAYNRDASKSTEQAMELLDFVGLADLPDKLASTLSYSKQRMLEIARAMATHPRVLLLDEPAAGLNTEEASELVGMLRGIRERGIALVVVEHNMDLVMNVAQRVFVMHHGVPLFEGTPREVQANPLVIEAYLGGEFAA
jgi:branched-chain amino acid transport system ATP-binding protein